MPNNALLLDAVLDIAEHAPESLPAVLAAVSDPAKADELAAEAAKTVADEEPDEDRDVFSSLLRTVFSAPGPPPRPNLVWKETTRRWINPHTGEDYDEHGNKPNDVRQLAHEPAHIAGWKAVVEKRKPASDGMDESHPDWQTYQEAGRRARAFHKEQKKLTAEQIPAAVDAVVKENDPQKIAALKQAYHVPAAAPVDHLKAAVVANHPATAPGSKADALDKLSKAKKIDPEQEGHAFDRDSIKVGGQFMKPSDLPIKPDENNIEYFDDRKFPARAVLQAALSPYIKQMGLDYKDRNAIHQDLPETTFTIADLHAGQPGVEESVVKKYIESGKLKSDNGEAVVIRWKGKNYLQDGHHRAVASVLTGQPTMKGKLIDLDYLQKATGGDPKKVDEAIANHPKPKAY